MIFLTVGSQLPFDRLTKAVDAWAANNPGTRLFGQIGLTSYVPQHFEYAATLKPVEYQSLFDGADFIISHVGMGTIISALDMGKPLLVMPRRAENGEVRNNHQFSTIKLVRQYKLIEVANDENEVSDILDRMVNESKQMTFEPEPLVVSPDLVYQIKSFIDG